MTRSSSRYMTQFSLKNRPDLQRFQHYGQLFQAGLPRHSSRVAPRIKRRSSTDLAQNQRRRSTRRRNRHGRSMQDESARRFDRLKSAGREPTARAALFPPALLAQNDGPNQSRNGFTSNSCAERCRSGKTCTKRFAQWQLLWENGNPPKGGTFFGRLAQRERRSLTRTRPGVQIPHRPP